MEMPRALTETETVLVNIFKRTAEIHASKRGVRSHEWTIHNIAQMAGLDLAAFPKEGVFIQALWVSFLSVMRSMLPVHELKYPTLKSFQQAYGSIFDHYGCKELQILWETANWMSVLFTIIPARKNKGLALTIVPKLVEGWFIKYVTGSGQTKATADRVRIFETEGQVKAGRRSSNKPKPVPADGDGAPAAAPPRRKTKRSLQPVGLNPSPINMHLPLLLAPNLSLLPSPDISHTQVASVVAGNDYQPWHPPHPHAPALPSANVAVAAVSDAEGEDFDDVDEWALTENWMALTRADSIKLELEGQAASLQALNCLLEATEGATVPTPSMRRSSSLEDGDFGELLRLLRETSTASMTSCSSFSLARSFSCQPFSGGVTELGVGGEAELGVGLGLGPALTNSEPLPKRSRGAGASAPVMFRPVASDIPLGEVSTQSLTLDNILQVPEP